MLALTRNGATHIAVATDHVIESFRNRLWPGYKTGDGIEPDLLAQFPLLEEALTAAGILVWPMVEFEADDALAAASSALADDPRVERVFICTPDKDLAQCVRGARIVQVNRRTRTTRDEAGVIQKFGVPPSSIPDYLALVGDAADGYPGLRGWGAEVIGCGSRPVRSSRTDSRRLARVGHKCREREQSREHAPAPARDSDVISGIGNTSHRYPSFRRCRRSAMERLYKRVFCVHGAIRQGSRE